MSRRMLSARTINKRIQRIMKEIELLWEQLDSLTDMVPAPTEAEVEAMIKGRQPVTLNALLLGIIYQAVFNLSETNVELERYAPYTPAAVRRAEGGPRRSDLLDFLRVAVQIGKGFHAEEEA